MNQPRIHLSSRRLGVVLFVFLIGCLLFGAQRGAARAQADPPGEPLIAIPWTADELGLARPSAEEVRAAVAQLPEGEPRAAEPMPRAAYSDATNDLLRKWLNPVADGEGLSASGGVMQADVPTQALGLPTSFRWQSVTFDTTTYNLAAFDIVPNSSTATFDGVSALLTDSTSTSIPAYADLTQVSINSNGPSTRWRLTSRGAHPAWPESGRLAYNNNFAGGSADLTHFIGATPLRRSGWRWALFDNGSFFPGWNDDLDIISVGVDPASNRSIRFSARVDGGLMNSYGADATWPHFEWYIDADNDTSSGENFTFSYQHGSVAFRYDLVGIDAIASAFYDADSGRWVGMLRKQVGLDWVLAATAAPSLSLDTVSIEFTETAAGLRSTFRWGLVSSFDIRRGDKDYFGRVDVAPNSGMKTESLPVSPDQLLAERYAPILMLANDKEELYPTTIDYTLAESVLRNKSGGQIDDNPTVDDLYNYRASEVYLDFTGADAAESIDHWKRGNKSVHPPVIYARVLRNLPDNQTIIQYWFQYFYSGYAHTRGCSWPGVLCVVGNNHEGDWEMIQVVLKGDVPQYAVFSQHEENTKRLWRHVEKGGDKNESPIVYVAYGSHASYFKNSFYKAQLQIGPNWYPELTGTYPVTGAGIQLLVDDGNPKWLEFKGYWGRENKYRLLTDNGGSPTGPRWEKDGSNRKKWASPLNWAEEAKWDDDYHYGSSFGLFSDAYKVTISGAASRHTFLQLKSDSGAVLLDRDVNTIDQTGKKAEFLLNCEANARQTILLHKIGKPDDSKVVFTLSFSEVTCSTGLRSEDAGAETVNLTIDLNIPQADMERIVTARFDNVEISTDGEASIDLDSANPVLEIDQDGDGVIDQTVAPTTTATEATDLTPPAAITNLAFADGQLRWTAPADNGPTGRAAAYQVRYAEFPVTNATWGFAEAYIHDLTPGAPGTQESLPLSGLPSGEYFFAVRSTDEAYNASPLSNQASGQVVGADEGFSMLVSVILR